MGLEAECSATSGSKSSEGTAYLGSNEIRFSGSFRVSIPFREIKSVQSTRGRLQIRHTKGLTELQLGDLAGKWLRKIRQPKSRVDKLGIKTVSIVCVLGIEEKEFAKELQKRTPHVSHRIRSGCDFVLFGCHTQKQLARFRPLSSKIKEAGAIWVVWPKGRAELNQMHIMAAAKTSGLVDVKVMSFSDELSALKLVIPIARRGKR